MCCYHRRYNLQCVVIQLTVSMVHRWTERLSAVMQSFSYMGICYGVQHQAYLNMTVMFTRIDGSNSIPINFLIEFDLPKYHCIFIFYSIIAILENTYVQYTY